MQAQLSLEGLSVGDAFGEQLLHAGKAARRLALDERVAPVGRTWMWSDDTAMAISIVETLAHAGRIEPDDLAERFARRYVMEPARGYGGGARQVLSEIAQGVPHGIAAGRLFGGQGSCGNGGGMRSAPIGAYFSGDVDAVVEHAARSAAPTHAHPDGAAGAVAVAVAAASVFAGERDPQGILEVVAARTPDSATRKGVRRALALLGADAITAAGMLGNGSHVLAADTVPFAIWCAATHVTDYEKALWACASVGGDIDTMCAMVGGIVVGAVGLEGIPAEWRAAREPLPQ
jgi:ADP-ribosylglycohydrolase